jgi:hypothetical protein
MILCCRNTRVGFGAQALFSMLYCVFVWQQDTPNNVGYQWTFRSLYYVQLHTCIPPCIFCSKSRLFTHSSFMGIKRLSCAHGHINPIYWCNKLPSCRLLVEITCNQLCCVCELPTNLTAPGIIQWYRVHVSFL